jgi:hypothetical protein
VKPSVWTARFLLKGDDVTRPRMYPITQRDADRASANTENRSEDGFFRFNVEEGEILVNMEHVVYWQNAYGLAPEWPPVEDNGRDDIGLTIYFAGCQNPMVLAVDPDEEEPRGKEKDEENNRCMIDMLLMGMESHETVSFYTFFGPPEPASGGTFHLKVGQIAMLLVPKALTNRRPPRKPRRAAGSVGQAPDAARDPVVTADEAGS